MANRSIVILCIISIAGLILTGIVFASANPVPSTYSQQEDGTPVTEAERDYAELIADELSSIPPADADLQRVFISASDGDKSALVVIGSGVDISAAIQDTLDQMNSLWRGARPPHWIKLDVVQESQVFEDVDFTQPVSFERSLYGIALDWDAGLAFLPEENVARTLIDSDGMVRFDNIAEYVPERHALMSALEPFTSTATGDLIVFETSSVFIDADEVLRLYRGHRVDVSLDPEDLTMAAVRGADYLAAAVDANGKFVYSYLPKTDREKDEYNILRHAGTTYSMIEVYNVTRDPVLLDAIERAIDYLVAQIQPCPGQTTGTINLCVVEDDFVKLGGNGLAVVVLAEYTAVTGDQNYLSLMTQLANWIQDAQLEDGSFVHKVYIPTNERDSFESLYYPGEAILGLTRLYAIDGNEQWLDVAENATSYLIDVRDAGLTTEELIHDHWLLYGINELYRFRPEPQYFEHAMRISQAIIMSQNIDPEYPDWWGSYYQPPRSTPTATRSEGLCAAYQLARDFGAEEAQQIFETLQRGLTFQLQTQFQPESVLYLADPDRVLGAFHHSLTNYEVRIDYVQHNISALLCAAEVTAG